jgi:hypothetical protein
MRLFGKINNLMVDLGKSKSTANFCKPRRYAKTREENKKEKQSIKSFWKSVANETFLQKGFWLTV